jgi:hypothetical protein
MRTAYNELPADYHSHMLQNMAFELYHHHKITKLFDKDRHIIRIYKYVTHDAKRTYEHIVKYNTMISLYEINSTRYEFYSQVLSALWNIETNPPP